MALLHYLSYVAIVAAFAFVTLSLASGLLYVSELIEEHSRLAKVIGQRGIYAIIALHIILYFFDSLPPLQTLFSISCHLVYLQNFSTHWPVISLASPSFVASSLLVIADHFIWFVHYSRVTQEARHTAQRSYRGAAQPYSPAFTDIATFFGVCVWLAPLFLFLSLSANDNALPTSSSESPSTSSGIASAAAAAPQKQRVSLFRSIFTLQSLPHHLRPKSTRRSTEGIIAPPRSPLPHQQTFTTTTTPNPLSPSSSLSPYGALSPPSPGGRSMRNEMLMAGANANGLGGSGGNGAFTLETPPLGPRRTQVTRRQTSDAYGGGLGRRVSSSSLAGGDGKVE